jgi:deoxyribose-phosphate aldolase
MVINIGKALGGDWDFVEQDVRAVCDEAHSHGAKVKVIFRERLPRERWRGLEQRRFQEAAVRDLRTCRCRLG